MSRSSTQKLANKVDLELFRLISRVEDAIAESRTDERRVWAESRFALSTARGHIRSLMSDEDRKATL